MMAYTTLLLLLVSLLGCFKTDAKIDKVLSLLVFASVCYILYNFYHTLPAESAEDVFSLMWNSSPGRDIHVDIISNRYNALLVLPLFIITALSIWQNQVFHHEEQRRFYSTLLCLNLVMLILMACGNNFVQLLTALFVVDILAVTLGKDIYPCRYFILFNMFADLTVFTVMAIINSRVGSFDMRHILKYRQMGFYVDFVAVAGIISVFIKLGMFGVHYGITALQNIRFHRLQSILFLFSAPAAIILLLKFHVLWSTSPYFLPLLNVVCIATMLYGFIGCLATDNLQAKTIYWQMMFWALFLELLRFSGFEWNPNHSFLLLEMYLFSCVCYLIYFYHGRRRAILDMVKYARKHTFYDAIGLVFMLLTIASMSNTLTIMYNNSNRYYIWTFAILFVLSAGITLNHIYRRTEQNKVLPEKNRVPYKVFYLLQLVIMLSVLLQNFNFVLPVWGFVLFFAATICFSAPLVFGQTNLSKIFNAFSGMNIYIALIGQIKGFGRFLRLSIDRKLIERTILELLSGFINGCLCLFRYIHKKPYLGIILLVMFWLLSGWLSYQSGEAHHG